MNARTFFFFFSTTGNLRRHNAIFLSGDNKLYIIISAASALSFCLGAIDASLDPPSTCSDRDIDTALIDVEMTVQQIYEHYRRTTRWTIWRRQTRIQDERLGG